MKRKYILSAGTIGIVLMMLGQLCFAINDTLVKEIVIDSQKNMSVVNVIFLRGIITTLFIFLYLKYYEKKNIISIFKIKKYHQRGVFEVLTAICFFTGLILLPVAEVYTLLMTNPFFVTICGISNLFEISRSINFPLRVFLLNFWVTEILSPKDITLGSRNIEYPLML